MIHRHLLVSASPVIANYPVTLHVGSSTVGSREGAARWGRLLIRLAADPASHSQSYHIATSFYSDFIGTNQYGTLRYLLSDVATAHSLTSLSFLWISRVFLVADSEYEIIIDLMNVDIKLKHHDDLGTV